MTFRQMSLPVTSQSGLSPVTTADFRWTTLVNSSSPQTLVEKPCPTATVTLSGWWRPVGAVSSGSGGLQKLRQIQHQAGSSPCCPTSNDHSESLQLIMAAGACSGGHYREIIDLRSSITKALLQAPSGSSSWKRYDDSSALPWGLFPMPDRSFEAGGE